MVKSKKKWRFNMRRREMATGYVFILPWLVGISYFFLANIIRAGRFAFNDVIILTEQGGGFELVPRGFAHFTNALTIHPDFVRMMTNTLINIMWNVPLIIFFSLFVAILLNRQFPGRTVVRAIFFLPVILAIPAIQGALGHMNAMMMGGMSSAPADFGGTESDSIFFPGFIIDIISQFGMPMRFVSYIIDAIARLHTVIRSGGVQMLIFLAALQSIPTSMYEVAKVEGATSYETFWKLTLPMISPIILTNVVYTIVDIYATSSPVNLAYSTSFGVQNFGLGAAFSIISAVVISVFLLIVGFIISRKVYYQT